MDGLIEDPHSVSQTDADYAMLDYATKLTQQPAGIEAEDIQKLRLAGFEDQAIHDLCAIVSYFAFANRIASGLGLELES